MESTMKKNNDGNNPQTNCVEDLVKTCVFAKRLHEFDHDYSRHKQMKKGIKDKRIRAENFPNIEAKLDIRLEEMESTRTEMTKELKFLEKKIIDSVADKIYSTADITEKLKQITPPTLKDLEEIAYKDGRLEDEITAANIEVDLRKESKIDKSQLPMISNVIDDADQHLQEYLQTTNGKVSEEIDEKYNSTAEGIRKSSLESSVDIDRLVKDATEKILQTSPYLKSQNYSNMDLAKRTKQALDDYLGSQLIDSILNPSTTSESDLSTIYPATPSKTISLPARETAKIRKCRQQRIKIKASVAKINQMKKEADDSIALFETNLNSYPLQNLAKNLEHIDMLLKNHQDVLEFMNDPLGEKKITEATSVPLSSRYQIPNTVNLNEVDKNLSSALATTVVGYTKQLCFSDLLERVSKLEERIQ